MRAVSRQLGRTASRNLFPIFIPALLAACFAISPIAAQTQPTPSGLTVNSATQTFAPPTSAPVIGPPAGAYKQSSPNIQVTITAPAGATIYYTTDGTIPTTSSTQYTGPFTVTGNISPDGVTTLGVAVVQAIAVAQGQTNSPVSSAVYQLNSSSVQGFLDSTSGAFDCVVTGLAAFSSTHPTGNVSFNDLTAGQSLGTGTLSSYNNNLPPAVYSVNPVTSRASGGLLVVGDFNGDGKPDIATGGSVLLGNGDGTFQPAIPNAGTSPGVLVAGDINDDGKLDLIYVNKYGNYSGFYTMLGNGDGSFQAPVYHDLSPLGPYVVDIAASNFGNGHLDLAVAVDGNGFASGSVYVLLGNGDGTFQAPVNVASGAPLGEILAADFNGDKKLDIAFLSVSNFTQISVALGNGDGTFRSPEPTVLKWVGGGYLTAGDFNHDGRTDLLLANLGVDELLGNGDGTFQEARVVDTSAGSSGIVTGDFFHNGITDFALTQMPQYSIPLIWAGNGDGTFAPFGDGVLTRNATAIYRLVAADFNGDGYSDLAFAPQDPSGNISVQVALGTASASSFAVLNDFSLNQGEFPVTRTYDCSYGGDSNYQGGSSPRFTHTFTTLPPPQFSPPAGKYAPGQTVSITDATAVSTIYYTTDGSVPTTNSAKYTAPVALSGNLTFNAMAIAQGYFNSPEASATYTPGLVTTKTSLASSAASVGGGQPITLTATVTGTSPTGSVTFTAGSTTLGSTNLINGTATLQPSFATAGNYSVNAAYSGDGNNATSTSNVVNVAVQTTVPTVTVTPYWTTMTSAHVNDPVTIKVVGPSGSPTPTGTLRLTGGGWVSPITPCCGGDPIYIPTGSITPGVDIMTAIYSGDSNYASSTGYATIDNTTGGPPNVTVFPTSAYITAQQSDTVIVGVTYPGGTPTGTVKLTGGGWAGQATLSAGSATINIPAGALASGPADMMTATYNGDYGSSAGIAPITVAGPAVTATLASITSQQTDTVIVNPGDVTGGWVYVYGGGWASDDTPLSYGVASVTIPAPSLNLGTVTLTAVYNNDYGSRTVGTTTITVTQAPKAAPTVSAWPTASTISYGKTLASSTLTGGAASVPGTFAWTVPSIAPYAGSQSRSVTFTPTDSTDYGTVTGYVTIAVNKGTPTVSAWPTASAITYGKALASSTLSGGTASVLGTFAWSAPSIVPYIGVQSRSVTFTPTDTTNYNTVIGYLTITVNKAAPTISAWPTASSISYGKTLASSTLTGGTASVPGAFAWSAPSIVPYAGLQSRSVTFTPSDSTNYNTVIGYVTITVNKATPTVSAWPTASAISYGPTLASSALTGGSASVPGAFAWTVPSIVPQFGVQSRSVTFTPADSNDYNTVTGYVTITVKAMPTVSAWPAASSISYGQTLASSTLTGGSASVPGTFVWSVPSIVPHAGVQSRSVTFTPTDSTNYGTVTGYVTITVNKATPTASAWPVASAIPYGETLASSTLTGGTASVPGTFAWSVPSIVPHIGVQSRSVTFTPTDTTDYNTVSGYVTITVNKATPIISAWPTASTITLGQTLASSTLTGGTASVPGAFAWSAPSIAPYAGVQSRSVTFTPADTTDYNTVIGYVTIRVN
ncbi:MAG TPA: FG-GAP-like repeat-containing protein [Terracidiphilus sp.]|nr:FG-GAP-like repeat-containing protein [Terracidiphilus sp.]